MMTEKEGVLLVKIFTDSKLNGGKFCRENGIKRSTLRYWIERADELAYGKKYIFPNWSWVVKTNVDYLPRKDLHFLRKC